MIPPFPLYSGWAEFWDLAGFRLASPFALRLRPPAATYRTRPAGIAQRAGVSLLVTVRGRKAPWPRVLIFRGAGVFQWSSAGVPGESLATLTLLRGADFGPPPSPFCSSVQPREVLRCPEGQIPCSLGPDSGRRCRLSGDRGPVAPPASLLLGFSGARSSSLRSTPSALLRPSERPLAPAPSPAKPLRSRSLLFLVCRRPSLRWPRAHTRVPGCTGPAEQTAPQFPNRHRSLSALLGLHGFAVSSTALPLCDCGLPPGLGVGLTGLFAGPSGAPNLCVRHLQSRGHAPPPSAFMRLQNFKRTCSYY
ncbi:hypothetical protein NDU88_011563 [Pleurodeles waltl]|uniref:Uncharacterized protein n=1 Tax=Pleurodeles waltl TaxID=8319 RepID=A0AAV7QXL8_PLEWA|nr:hypothetical protein NDU88_011563 [Pleurodeles waltl]